VLSSKRASFTQIIFYVLLVCRILLKEERAFTSRFVIMKNVLNRKFLVACSYSRMSAFYFSFCLGIAIEFLWFIYSDFRASLNFQN